MAAFYAARARGGVGLIVSGGFAPDERGRSTPEAAKLTTPAEAEQAFDQLSAGGGVVVKAQVHAGGRGKGIAIGPEDDRAEALEIARGRA